MNSFTVVSVVREERAVVDRFVGWHLHLGAERVILYFDDPSDCLAGRYAGDPRVMVLRCSPEFCRNVGVDPTRRFPLRQKAMINHGYRLASTPWVLVVDADELVHLDGRHIADLLGAVPSDISGVRFLSAETVLVEGEVAPSFRTPIPKDRLNAVYGKDAHLFRKRSGLSGHTEGKSFVRTGFDRARVRMHWALDENGSRLPEMVLGPPQGAHLLHFLLEDYPTWRAKVPWRMSSFGFSSDIKMEIDRINAQGGDVESALKDLHRRLSWLTRDRAARLEADGGLLRLDVDFGGVAAEMLARG